MIAGYVAQRYANLRRALLAPTSTGRRAHETLNVCNQVGEHPILMGRPYVINDGHIQIGNRFRLSSQPVTTHLVAERAGHIVIGDDVTIGHGSGLAAHASITIGDGTCLGAFVLVMDTDFHVPGDSEAQAPSTPIVIGRNVRVGNHVTILRGSSIGDGAIILDGSVVSGKVDSGVRITGVPARVLPGDDEDEGPQTITPRKRIAFVAMHTFRLSSLPSLETSRDEIPSWDSLGALNFMLALEEEFSLVLGEDDMIRAHTLADIERVIREIQFRKRPSTFPASSRT
jgi:acetyltransferase-like isoleucine patch superfamily enzyme/acyl carrier protein